MILADGYEILNVLISTEELKIISRLFLQLLFPMSRIVYDLHVKITLLQGLTQENLTKWWFKYGIKSVLLILSHMAHAGSWQNKIVIPSGVSTNRNRYLKQKNKQSVDWKRVDAGEAMYGSGSSGETIFVLISSISRRYAFWQPQINVAEGLALRQPFISPKPVLVKHYRQIYGWQAFIAMPLRRL